MQLRQDKITLILTSPLEPGGELNRHLNDHGDGVKNVALWVEDATKSWEETTKRGAKSAFKPYTIEDDHGKVVLSGIHTYGETIHIFVERKITTERLCLAIKLGIQITSQSRLD